MPNWCMNEVTVTGDEMDLIRFRNLVKSEAESFSFQSVIPMPDELMGTNSPVTIMTEEEIAEHKEKEKINPIPLPFNFNPMTQEQSDRLTEQYGTNNWYDWAYDNWGTKWDTSDVERKDSIESVDYIFQTAWCPPEPIYEHLVALFPNLYINWYYREDGMEMAGYLNND